MYQFNKIFLFFLFLTISASNIPAQTAEQLKQSQKYERLAVADYKDKNYENFLQNMSLANNYRPNHPRLIYNLAIAYTLAGKPKLALYQLERLAKMGLFFAFEKDEDFKSLFELPKFKSLLNDFQRNKTAFNQSSKAFELPQKDLITESVAFNPLDKRFFVSSVHQRKILSIDAQNQVSEFSKESDGLWSVLGMKVDEQRQVLWVCTTAFPQMTGFEKKDDGRSGIFKYDLKTGKLLKKYLLSNDKQKHALGDLIVARNGDVYATDSISPIIYKIDSQKDELEVFIEDENFSSLQGLTFAPGEGLMFVADYSKGIFLILLKSKSIYQLTPDKNITVLGIDGLYYHKDTLIAIQNGVNPQRVIRLFLDKNYYKIKKFETLEANHADFNEPTLGLILGNEFYYIANSQWPLVNEKGELKTEELKNPVVLKLKL